MTKLDLASQKRLHCSCAATNINQTGIEPVLLENFVFLGKPKRADASRYRAIGGSDRHKPGLSVGLNRNGAAVEQRKNRNTPNCGAKIYAYGTTAGRCYELYERSDHESG